MILTIVSPEQLDSDLKSTLSSLLKDSPIVLSDCALEYQCAETDKQQIDTLLQDQPLDYFLQPDTKHRRKKLLLADMDSTIVISETLDDLATKVGIGEKVAGITKRAMNGKISFIDALHERVSLLAGKSTQLLEDTWQEIVYTDGAKTLVKTMKQYGTTCILASGGFHFFADKVANELGFDKAYANTLNTDNDTITGTVKEPILTGHVKKEILLESNVPLEQTLTVGDGANDLAMIKTANEHGGLGVAYFGKPLVQERARYNIRYTNLSTLLYLQGYKKEEWL